VDFRRGVAFAFPLAFDEACAAIASLTGEDFSVRGLALEFPVFLAAIILLRRGRLRSPSRNIRESTLALVCCSPGKHDLPGLWCGLAALVPCHKLLERQCHIWEQ